jgi:DNA end-binding protein Ku
VLTDADFKHANVKASETIEVETFCDAKDIPYLYYEKPYYLAPAKGGAKVYSLLRQTLSATGKVAVELKQSNLTQSWRAPISSVA